MLVLIAMLSCLVSGGGDASDPGARCALLNFATGQRAEARRIANPRLQGFSAPARRPSAKRYLRRELASGDAPIDTGSAQGGDTDHVVEAVEGRIEMLRDRRGILGMWHGCALLGVPDIPRLLRIIRCTKLTAAKRGVERLWMPLVSTLHVIGRWTLLWPWSRAHCLKAANMMSSRGSSPIRCQNCTGRCAMSSPSEDWSSRDSFGRVSSP